MEDAAHQNMCSLDNILHSLSYNLAWKEAPRFDEQLCTSLPHMFLWSQKKNPSWWKQVKKCVHQQCLKHRAHFIFNTRKAELLWLMWCRSMFFSRWHRAESMGQCWFREITHGYSGEHTVKGPKRCSVGLKRTFTSDCQPQHIGAWTETITECREDLNLHVMQLLQRVYILQQLQRLPSGNLILFLLFHLLTEQTAQN